MGSQICEFEQDSNTQQSSCFRQVHDDRQCSQVMNDVALQFETLATRLKAESSYAYFGPVGPLVVLDQVYSGIPAHFISV